MSIPYPTSYFSINPFSSQSHCELELRFTHAIDPDGTHKSAAFPRIKAIADKMITFHNDGAGTDPYRWTDSGMVTVDRTDAPFQVPRLLSARWIPCTAEVAFTAEAFALGDDDPRSAEFRGYSEALETAEQDLRAQVAKVREYQSLIRALRS